MRAKFSILFLVAVGITSLAIIAAKANAKSDHHKALTSVKLDVHAAEVKKSENN